MKLVETRQGKVLCLCQAEVKVRFLRDIQGLKLDANLKKLSMELEGKPYYL